MCDTSDYDVEEMFGQWRDKKAYTILCEQYTRRGKDKLCNNRKGNY